MTPPRTEEPGASAQQDKDGTIQPNDGGVVSSQKKDKNPQHGGSSSWRVRPATPADRASCRAVLRQSYESMLAPDYDAALLQQVLDDLSEPQEPLLQCGTWYVVVDDDVQEGDEPTTMTTRTTTEQPPEPRIVGCGGWTARRPESKRHNEHSNTADDPSQHHAVQDEALVPHLRHFAVHPDYARRGIGKAIWQRCYDDIAQQFVLAPANSEEENRPFPAMEVFSSRTAESFYASLGFRLVKRMDLEMKPGIFMPVLLMRREP